MKFKPKFLSLLPALLLTACGYGLKEVYPGTVYNSVDYYQNFYREWDKNVNYHKDGSKVENIDGTPKELSSSENLVFTRFSDLNFLEVQPDRDNYSYSYDIYEPTDGKKSYGQTFALSKNEQSFKYGYVSKLFNGQMFCNGSYEIARVQIDENGFGMEFSKELDQYSYFALNFKASLDYRKDGVSTNLPAHESSVRLFINFYCKTDNQKYHRVPVYYDIEHIKTNASETLLGDNYTFFGFSLSGIGVERCVGISIEYELLNDEYINAHPDEGWTHCLLLYELFLPNSTWH